MLIPIIIIIVVSITAILLDSFSVIFISTLLLSLGNVLITFLADKANKKIYHKIFNTTFLAYTLYAMICTMYMLLHNYDHLLVSDTITAYIPYTQDFLKLSSMKEMWDQIYNNDIYKYQHTGCVIIYFTIIGKIASIFDNELYFNLQSSIIFLSSFISLFIYKLLKEQGINSALKYTFIYSFLSIHFYYSTLILRDIPIALFYIITFCYIMYRNRTKAICIISLCILGSFLIRPQSAFFLMLFTIIVFVEDKIKLKTVLLITIATSIISYIFIKMEMLSMLNETLEHSDTLLQVKAGESTLNKFNSLPPIISHIVKIIYIQLSPIPSWSFMSITATPTEVVNNMGFPRTIAVLYNYVILGFIIYGIFNIKKIKINYKILFAFLFTLLYMGLQTDSTEQRRIMACYPILLLFACKVNDAIKYKKSKSIKNYMILLFIVMQFLGLSKYI